MPAAVPAALSPSPSSLGPPSHVQLSLDLGTPLEVVEMLRGVVEAHVRANASEFTAACSGAVLRRQLGLVGRSVGRRSVASAADASSQLASMPCLPLSLNNCAVVVRSLGDPLKLAVSIHYEFSHSGIDGGRVARAR